MHGMHGRNLVHACQLLLCEDSVLESIYQFYLNLKDLAFSLNHVIFQMYAFLTIKCPYPEWTKRSRGLPRGKLLEKFVGEAKISS